MPPESKAGTQADLADSDEGAQAEPESTKPQAGTPEPQAGDGGDEPEALSVEEARKIRSENRSLRDRLRPLEAAERARQDAARAELPDLEKAQVEIAELKATIAEMTTREQDHRIRVAAIEAATKLGFRSPAIAYRLLDRHDIEFAEDGSAKNVESLLKKIAEADPYLVRDGQPDFGGGRRGKTPESAPDMNDLLRAAGRPR